MKKLIIYIVILFVFASIGHSATYYVKSGGNDGSDGLSDGNAWATTERVNTMLDALGSGTTTIVNFNRGDTWSSDEALGQNGGGNIDFPDLTLTFQAYGAGANPKFNTETMRAFRIVDANDLDITITDIDVAGGSSSYTEPIYIASVGSGGSILIDGVDGDGRGDGSVSNPSLVIHIYDVLATVEIKNCALNGYGPATNPTSGDDTVAITVMNNDAVAKTTYTKIHTNTIHSINSDAVQVRGFRGTGGASKMEIYGNTFYNCGENAIDVKNSIYVEIYQNTLYRNDWALGGSGDVGNLIVIHKSSQSVNTSDEIRIYENYFNGNHTITAHIPAMLLGAKGQLQNTYIYENLIVNCSPGIVMYSGTNRIRSNLFLANESISESGRDLAFIRKTGGGASFVYNNSMYATSGSGMLYGYSHEVADASGKTKNNIFELHATNAVGFYDYGETSPDVDYNIYHGTDTERIIYNGTTYEHGVNFAAGDSGGTDYAEIAGHTNEISDNSDMADPANTDFTLTSVSPAIDAALDLGGVSYNDAWDAATSLPPNAVDTLDRDTYGWDMGAYVYVPAATPPTMSGTSIGTNGTTLTLTFSAAITQGAGYNDADFDLDISGGTQDVGVTYSSGNTTATHIYTISQTINYGESVDIDFNGAANSMENGVGTDLAAIVSGAVSNNSQQNAPSASVSTVSGGNVSVESGGNVSIE